MKDPVSALIREGVAREIKRGPVPDEYQWGGIQLGQALEVELSSGHVIRWKSRPRLFWNDVGRYLGLAEGWGKPSRGRLNFDRPGMPQKVPNLFAAFHGRKPESALDWNNKSMPDRWVSLGGVERIDYHSTKHDARKSYTHDHGRGVRMYRFGGQSRAIWVIKGGSLTVTGRGIVN